MKQSPLIQIEPQQALTYTETQYWENGTPPTPENLAQHFDIPLSEAKRLIKEISEDLDKRGIAPAQDLTAQQMLVANVMLTTDRKSEAKRLNDLNELFKQRNMPTVSMQKWNAWKRTPAMQNYIRTRAREQFKADDYKFYQSILRGVEEGDLGHTKLYGEVSGLYNPRLQIDVNIPGLINTLFEILSKHLPPEQLEVIGLELEKSLDGISE